MPSGPPELHRKWGSDLNAQNFLRARGYTLTKRWEWIVPTDHEPTYEEREAIYYLQAEWDFGGIASKSQDGSTQ